jgi:hypothetical protein
LKGGDVEVEEALMVRRMSVVRSPDGFIEVVLHGVR